MTRTGEVMDCLDNPPTVPDLFEHAWSWFLDLNEQRQEMRRLSWSDMRAYFDFVGVRPSMWDVEIIQMLDRQFLEIMLNDDAETVSTAI